MNGSLVSGQACEAKRMRKILKPVMEKRRRERINQSLEELRLLLLEITGDQKLQNPKLEKAEILELTVHYLRGKARLKSDAASKEKDATESCYLSGFRECLFRMSCFLGELQPSLQRRFLESLQTHLQLKSRKNVALEPPSPGKVPAHPLQPAGYPPGPFAAYLLEDFLAKPTRVPSCLPAVPKTSSPCTPPCCQARSEDAIAHPHGPGNLPESQRQGDESGAHQEKETFWRPWP
ncbi:transcription factor HES-7-like [Rhinatrema bivittatum]|uniref:transcription factor HES-7-like n=1 Tax=Rhinatrema bivittatum TaxID=194408 RepID=UPI00112A55DA|nr:transcription factor HES-7-like [Rhinatrema bivittatum]